jgi:hypothetical protein
LLVQHKEDLGHSPAFAVQLAYGEAIKAWHEQCGPMPHTPLVPAVASLSPVLPILPDGAKVHPTDNCLIGYGAVWRSAAAAGLAVLGIEPPEGWQP